MVIAKVNLWGHLVGAVLWNESSGIASFEFNPDFPSLKLDIAPITLPISAIKKGQIFQFRDLSKETYKGLPGLLADSLPDKFGNQLIDAWLSTQGKAPDSMNPVERLCYIGKRGMGALEFEPAIKFGDNRSRPIEVDALVELAQMVLDNRYSLNTKLLVNGTGGLSDILKVGTSAGGARPKAIIALNENTGEVRSGQLNMPDGFTYWLMKLDGVSENQQTDPKGYGRIEFAYYKMAIDSGIIMSESRMLEENGRAHFLTRRFDRTAGNRKLHMQTLCGLCHYDFNYPLLYSYEQVFQAMRILRLPYSDAEQMFTRMVFNVVSNNNDDHTKNISFLMNESGEWSLAPAYDITYAYNPDNIWLSQHQLSMNGKRKYLKIEDLLEVGKQMSIKKSKEIIERVIKVVVNWEKYAEEAGIHQERIKLIGINHFTKL